MTMSDKADDDESLDQKYYRALREKDELQREIFALRAEIHRLKERLQNCP